MTTTRRIIEGTWTCSSCDTAKIPGSQKLCPECGNPRNDDEAKFDFGATTASGASTLATVEDTTKLELAAAGADWYCAVCDAANRGSADRCGQCGNTDPTNRLAKKAEKPATPAANPPKVAKPTSRRAVGCGCGILTLGALLCGGLLYWGFSAKELTGKVTSVRWERSIDVEQFTPVTLQAFRKEIPSTRSVMPKNGKGGVPGATNIRGCVTKETKAAGCETKQVREACGTETKCHTKDLGNGFAEEVCEEETKYCSKSEEVCHDAEYAESCTYDSHAWKKIDTRKASGKDNKPQWPEVPPLGALDRQVKAGNYWVSVEYNDGGEAVKAEHTVEEREFPLLNVGSPVTVAVSRLGGVEGIHPAKNTP
jgi:hypothetical protein